MFPSFTLQVSERIVRKVNNYPNPNKIIYEQITYGLYEHVILW